MMSDFDYSLDVDSQQDSCEEEIGWKNLRPAPGPMHNPRRFNIGYMNAQYSGAFGDYRGGYGPGGGFGPRPWPYPGPMRGRGFGPIGQPLQRPRLRGPPVHMAAHLLADCDVNPEYIRNLPWELLDMIEPGYCGLCSQDLENFSAAKVHYNCKNHYKAQKKFLAQLKTSQRVTEMPMKARNLYCELCDVHITSKLHADSHYAGKSHRATVIGRKLPKNPMLLQAGMDDRINQLIRREKKHMKSIPEPVKVEVKLAVDKNVPPELVCDICKTAVTCSEQMTSHLNGKRHLTKEKQHILKMMKGEANKIKAEDEDEADAEGVTGADADDQEENEQSATAAASQDDDWTSGGGADWDNQRTVTE